MVLAVKLRPSQKVSKSEEGAQRSGPALQGLCGGTCNTGPNQPSVREPRLAKQKTMRMKVSPREKGICAGDPAVGTKRTISMRSWNVGY
jgi:hypothetical protein